MLVLIVLPLCPYFSVYTNYQLSGFQPPNPFHIVEDGSGESLVVTARANFDCPPPKSDGAQAFCLNGKVPVKYARVEHKKFSGI